jgi:hypothetical protein
MPRRVARHPDVIHESQRAARRAEPVPEPLRHGHRVGLGGREHAPAAAGCGDGNAGAPRVLRGPARSIRRDDAACARLRRQPGIADHQPGDVTRGRAPREVRIEVVHQTGDKDLVATRQRYPRIPPAGSWFRSLPSSHEEMAWADLVLSARSGAMTVAELAAAGRPSILVPFGARRRRPPDGERRGLCTKAGAARS